jgi:transcriptional regulator with XRE-family HTH domain
MNVEPFLQSVGQKIAAQRKAKPLTQKAVAEQAGVSYRYYQSVESGVANITLSTLFKLARFFGVHPRDLL